MLMKTSAEETVWIEFVCFQSDRAAEEHMLQTAAHPLATRIFSEQALSQLQSVPTQNRCLTLHCHISSIYEPHCPVCVCGTAFENVLFVLMSTLFI